MHVGKRKEIYERLHPETKATKAGGPGRKKRTQCQLGTETAPAFIDDTAKKTGKGRSSVTHRAKRAKDCVVLADIVTAARSGPSRSRRARM